MPGKEQIFAKRSQRTLHRVHHTVDTFIQVRDIIDSKTKPLRKQNLSKGEQKALNGLQKRNYIVITKADREVSTLISRQWKK